MKTEYPWQINSVIHKTKAETKTLGIDALLFSPKEEDESRTPAAPLEMHEGYSRFKGTLIVKKSEKDKSVLTFNIPAKSVPYIHSKTKLLMQQNMNSESIMEQTRVKSTEKEEAKESSSSKAYTTIIKTGKLRDKTPAAVLLETPENMKLLENQLKWLQDNLAKFPDNQLQIDGIKDAINLYKEGKLTASSVEEDIKSSSVSKTYTIYETPCKNIQPLDEEGRYTIYQFSIKYTPKNNLPFTIEVMNCFAPVDKTKGNQIVMSKAVKKKVKDIRLSEEEWYTMIDSMKAAKIMFENLTYPEQLKLAAKISKENYEASKTT